MAENKVQVQMSKEQEFKSCTRYVVKDGGANEVWETICVEKKALGEIGNPDVVTVTIEAYGFQADACS